MRLFILFTILIFGSVACQEETRFFVDDFESLYEAAPSLHNANVATKGFLYIPKPSDDLKTSMPFIVESQKFIEDRNFQKIIHLKIDPKTIATCHEKQVSVDGIFKVSNNEYNINVVNILPTDWDAIEVDYPEEPTYQYCEPL